MRKRLTLLLVVALVGVVVLSGCGPTAVAKYDAGKSLQRGKHLKDAIAKYNEYIAENKGSPLVGYAMLNIARCHVALADKPAAMEAYQKVVAQHPQSDVARWAETEMRDIKDKKLEPVVKPKPKVDPKKKAAEKKAAEKKGAEMKAAEKKAAEKKAAEMKAAEKKAAEKKTAEMKAAEKKAAEMKAAEKKAAEKKAAEKKAAEKKAAEKKPGEKKKGWLW